MILSFLTNCTPCCRRATFQHINLEIFTALLAAMLSEETAIQQNDGVDMLPLELGLLRASILCLSGARSSANMPGNAALCEPIDLQSESSKHEAATFYKHSRYLSIYLSIYIYIYIYI